MDANRNKSKIFFNTLWPWKDLAIVFSLLVCIPMLLQLVSGGTLTLTSILLGLTLHGVPLSILYIGARKKNLLLSITIAVSWSYVLSMGIFQHFKNVSIQTIGLFASLLFSTFLLINLILIFTNWKTKKAKALIPFVITILTIPLVMLSSGIGEHVHLRIFNKQLPHFERAVKMLKGQITQESVSLRGDEIPEDFRQLAYMIIGEKLDGDKYAVSFLWGSGIPVKHSAFVYISDGQLPEEDSEFRRFWPRCKRINDNWFEAHD